MFEQSNLPGEIPALFESFFQDVNGNMYPLGEPSHPSTSLVAGGTWNEDDYDIVFGYSEQYPGISIASVSHFWNPDNSDRYAKNNLEFVTGSTENAFKKAEYLWNGTGKFYMPGPFQFADGTEEQLALDEELGLSYTTSYTHLIIGYDSLPLMYKENKYYIWGVRLVSGTTLMFENPREINNSPYYFPIFFSANILGRIAHLLADMSVPAHVKLKSHPCNIGWG